MNISKKQILSTTVQINSSDIYKIKNIDGLILHKLKTREGKSFKHGYIIKGSVSLINRSIGKIRNIDNKSLIEYKLSYSFDSILPSIGDIYECIIASVTKMGLIGYVEYESMNESMNDIKTTPLLIIVPKEYCDIGKQKEGRKIKIETIDKRIKYMGTQIQVVGKIID